MYLRIDTMALTMFDEIIDLVYGQLNSLDYVQKDFLLVDVRLKLKTDRFIRHATMQHECTLLYILDVVVKTNMKGVTKKLQVSVLSLSRRYHKCPSFAALTHDIYDIVPKAIKLISPRPSYNLYLQFST
jgi:hypothetical protein